MTFAQGAILAILFGAMALFIWGRWRHDLVAMMALLAGVAVGQVPVETAFSGFGHPAVITVASVLVLSKGLFNSGAIDILARHALPAKAGPTMLILSMSGLAAFLSAFMNNVGALALMMPVVIQAAQKNNIHAGLLLMPVSFGSILGGMTTLIGTPPNIIISGFRDQAGKAPFAMFDFAPVGLSVVVAGIAFITLIGWRLLPKPRQQSKTDNELFDVGNYFTEIYIPDGTLVGRTLAAFEKELAEVGGQIIGLVRDDERFLAPSRWRRIKADDILVVEAEPQALTDFITAYGLKLVDDRKMSEEALEAADIEMMEVAVRPGSPLDQRSVKDIQLRSRFGVNLLGLSRQGRRLPWNRLRDQRLKAGDVLLLQGRGDRLADVIAQFNCVPLVQRGLKFPRRRETILAVAIMGAAIALTTLAGIPAQIVFAAAAVLFVITRLVPLRNLYDSIDWSVIVLLGAMIPLATAMEETGTAAMIANTVINNLSGGSPVIALALILIVTMTLSDFMNNAATAAVMAPIAVVSAHHFGSSPDAFLMAVAIGASCAFLTPIGHQNNTLILGPGGYRFGDYWRMGLPLEIVVIAVSLPALLFFWPLTGG
ncbi:SLC13 family permease [Telmatospirillum sp. J64-1]|uniref:SLC13 family permease n=1 Tax=Telmatospirillum sp. J64-1 TaxID=2502183 RepID=UPI00115DDB12|nr:SLC13 family permease [Telmatospirillum sp. J64-1]